MSCHPCMANKQCLPLFNRPETSINFSFLTACNGSDGRYKIISRASEGVVRKAPLIIMQADCCNLSIKFMFDVLFRDTHHTKQP